ncbi:MAG: hypothetical protein WBP41_12935 [Saprospiraceae bacterium]
MLNPDCDVFGLKNCLMMHEAGIQYSFNYLHLQQYNNCAHERQSYGPEDFLPFINSVLKGILGEE